MSWTQIDANNDGFADWAWDGDNDGVVEEVWIDAHGDGDYDARIIDANEDGHAEWINVSANGDDYRNVWLWKGQYDYGFVDSDRNGTYDRHYYDAGRDGNFENIRLDTDGDGHADTWYENRSSFADQANTGTSAGALAVMRMWQAHNNTMVKIWL